MATYEQMIENLVEMREAEMRYGGSESAFGYAKAIADVFGKDMSEVRAAMKAGLIARGL